MNKNFQKDWTVLIYINGNNDIEPEIRQAMLAIKNADINENANVLVQISREEWNLVKIIRPLDNLPESDDKWVGVRRYYIKGRECILIEDLKKINMADPMCLYDFIKWGIKNYSAKNYMLIIGGHGCVLKGALADYSQDNPYMMGIPEINIAIDKACKEVNSKIDILVIDMCYFNLLEIIYEFGKDKDHSVKSILTYIGEGPIQGLPYEKMINLLEENDTEDTIKKIIDNLNYNLVAFQVDNTKFEKIKSLFNELAHCYLDNKKEELKSYELLSYLDVNQPWYSVIKDIKDSMNSIVIYSKKINNNLGLINIMTYLPSDSNQLYSYYKLSFTSDNKWAYLISDKKTIDNINLELKPIKISYQAVCELISIMNPLLSTDDKELILNNLINYKNWKLK
ncbi:clostripain-related cysteine peptidase [Tepidibacter hydrothermalis]|uniref:Clostripain-related cysteine peptidase n=1 Tax=Tepidibacter hydrothermalis TaxID=3036126 RepID=A0ABY8EEN9_9FIRM|nr:clostripain-related cysteine peptidase [Tepidibacter hydrothermalis]WFD11407.1 clostripain-related cysteine peptidase [Tepidibacter hydrothermalis]